MTMNNRNEAETCADLINPQLAQAGWGVVEGSKIYRERNVYKITNGRIIRGQKQKPLIADYVLEYRGRKLATIEAKAEQYPVGAGVQQAKQYAEKLQAPMAYATNGNQIYAINMKTGIEGLVPDYPTPQALWQMVYSEENEWRNAFAAIPFERKGKKQQAYYYQDLAINKTLEAVANGEKRVLLTLATGTGKTTIAAQIAWKLFKTKWNLKLDKSRAPRILFLADRNNLAIQAMNEFAIFADDARTRITTKEIKKIGRVPKNATIFFTIFQTFMSGKDGKSENDPYFGDYAPDYFDVIFIDECHRGGANDESRWRAILDYFQPALQIGLTATPKRDNNVDSYDYFGEPVYIYSLKAGIEDGFLTPFRVRRITTTLDEYAYEEDDDILQGEINREATYTEKDFNRKIEITPREVKRVQLFLEHANPNDKTIIFCATQEHALMIRDIVNQYATSHHVNYCVRVTSDDGDIGEQFLKYFKDNVKNIPTILTTSQKLSTGVDVPELCNIVLMRKVKSIIEFKQIIGRGTRLFNGKYFFTIYDFVGASEHFKDPDWDGEPDEITGAPEASPKPPSITDDEIYEPEKPVIIKVRLADGKQRDIQHQLTTLFLDKDGNPITHAQFMQALADILPTLFDNGTALRDIWSKPETRQTWLDRLDDQGFDKDNLQELQQIITQQECDLLDVLQYIFDGDYQPISRQARTIKAKDAMAQILNEQEQEFIDFVSAKYVEIGMDELWNDKLAILLENKYGSIRDAQTILGETSKIRALFIDFQKYLYKQ